MTQHLPEANEKIPMIGTLLDVSSDAIPDGKEKGPDESGPLMIWRNEEQRLEAQLATQASQSGQTGAEEGEG